MKYQSNQKGKYCNLKQYATKYVVLPLALTGLVGATIVSNGCANLPKKQEPLALEGRSLNSDVAQHEQEENKKKQDIKDLHPLEAAIEGFKFFFNIAGKSWEETFK